MENYSSRGAPTSTARLSQVDIEAESAWIAAKDWIWQNWDPDNGVMLWASANGARCSHRPAYGAWKQIPKLPARTKHTIRAVGGIERIWCDIQNDQYTWIKREFIEAWKRSEKVEKLLQVAATKTNIKGE